MPPIVPARRRQCNPPFPANQKMFRQRSVGVDEHRRHRSLARRDAFGLRCTGRF
jgi:hypothetical protein